MSVRPVGPANRYPLSSWASNAGGFELARLPARNNSARDVHAATPRRFRFRVESGSPATVGDGGLETVCIKEIRDTSSDAFPRPWRAEFHRPD